ncbi:DNA-(apurinic or apyrimidinic site) lyase [Conoideocrella luteorostrata]|uniref:Apurinic-apyrimidinic endonuclease 1 n=1 Tax=Conoideocrella luteorostrata TaxID=1105319 RepID=A0AAJ0CV58_9HYPO|nr:DNA-(apurinic or apyrimidinic site) lyase [Conoideocrella luteorostrata]
MLRTSPRRKPLLSYTEGSDGMTTSKPSRTPGAAAKDKKALSKTPAKAAQKRKADAADDGDHPESTPQQKKRKARAKAKAADNTMPLVVRTAVSSLKKTMYIGAHVSAAGGVQNSVLNAMQIGANSFALFLKSQRKWNNPPISPEDHDLFVSNCKKNSYSAAEHALPHGSYLVNLAQADETKATQAYNSFVDDLRRCEQLGIKLYNFHPGSTGGDSRQAAIGRIAAQLNKSHKATESVITVLENMAGAGNVIGSTWEDLRDIIALVDDKERVGVCIDTCHAFTAGYDLRTSQAFQDTMEAFRKTVGFKYLKALHLNDSKAPFNSNRDLHANIGTGFLGLRAFHHIMNHDNFRNMPMVLETPIDRKGPDGKTTEDKQIWADEIKLLESLIGMDVESNEFEAKSEELQAEGAAERSRIQDQVDKKIVKGTKKASKLTAAPKRKRPRGSDDDSH